MFQCELKNYLAYPCFTVIMNVQIASFFLNTARLFGLCCALQ